MAHTQTNSTFSGSDLLGKLFVPFAALWRGMIAVAQANSRVKEIEALSKLSDKQLAKRGIRREDIVHHVFADRLHV